MNPLDSEELEILEAFERGELKRTINATQEIEQHKAYADATFKRQTRINIRLPPETCDHYRHGPYRKAFRARH